MFHVDSAVKTRLTFKTYNVGICTAEKLCFSICFSACFSAKMCLVRILTSISDVGLQRCWNKTHACHSFCPWEGLAMWTLGCNCSKTRSGHTEAQFGTPASQGLYLVISLALSRNVVCTRHYTQRTKLRFLCLSHNMCSAAYQAGCQILMPGLRSPGVPTCKALLACFRTYCIQLMLMRCQLQSLLFPGL